MPKRSRSGAVRRNPSRRARYAGVRRSMVSRNIPQVYRFKRSFRLPQIVFNVGTTSMYGQEFKFSDMPNSSEFSNLFDVYKIDKIKIVWVATATGADVNPATTHIFVPNLLSVIDHTDSSAPSGINELMQYPGCKRTKLTNTHTRILKPHVASDLVGQLGTTGYQSKPWPYVSFGIDVTGYGVKWGLDQVFNVATNLGIGVDRYVTYYFSCKSVR